jgi:hypothetical protein
VGPIFLPLPRHRRARRVLHLNPIQRAAFIVSQAYWLDSENPTGASALAHRNFIVALLILAGVRGGSGKGGAELSPFCAPFAWLEQNTTALIIVSGVPPTAKDWIIVDIGSTTARSVDEVALIRDAISHYAPVLIATLSIQIRRAGASGRIFSIA